MKTSKFVGIAVGIGLLLLSRLVDPQAGLAIGLVVALALPVVVVVAVAWGKRRRRLAAGGMEFGRPS